MADEQKPDEKKPKRSAAMEERIRLMRERGVKINESGKNIAIIGVSSGPADAAPQPADALKPDAPAASSEAQPADPSARKDTETLYEFMKRQGVKIANDRSKPSGGITIVGTGKSSEPEGE